ncbi:MAG: 6-phosphofructokinase [Candidatus Omnitrophica bacterium]|jgi:6-phosphofructokinase 1|nr:6-phosphofructokinase [Candidatus Omnitrophota bacterium]
MKRIAVLTTGGDAPGMNAAVRAVVRSALARKVEVMGVYRGYQGLIDEDIKPLNHRSVSGIINQGGTILKTARCPEFKTEDGKKQALETLKRNNIEGMIVIGGNGSFSAAHEFYLQYQFPCVGIPASIDNDVNGIDVTIGSDTAINTALDAIDKVRDTATSMERIFVIEVMGRECGYMALQVALAGGCEDVIIPEKKCDFSDLCHSIVGGNIRGKISWIIVLAEGAAKAEEVARNIRERTSLETRSVVLGHVQRGGKPTAFSRTLALNLGQLAVESLLSGEADIAVGLRYGELITIDFEDAVKKKEWDVEKLYRLLKTVS